MIRPKRTSVVEEFVIISVGIDSSLHFGDTYAITPSSKVFALSRKIPTFRGDEGSFNYPIFTRPAAWPKDDEPVHVNTNNVNAYIKVDRVKILATAVAAVVQVGSNCIIRSENRTKHIRQLNMELVP